MSCYCYSRRHHSSVHQISCCLLHAVVTWLTVLASIALSLSRQKTGNERWIVHCHCLSKLSCPCWCLLSFVTVKFFSSIFAFFSLQFAEEEKQRFTAFISYSLCRQPVSLHWLQADTWCLQIFCKGNRVYFALFCVVPEFTLWFWHDSLKLLIYFFNFKSNFSRLNLMMWCPSIMWVCFWLV